MIYRVFPYELVNKGDSIIIFGANEIGRYYCNQIYNSGYCTIKAIVDNRYQSISGFPVTVQSPSICREYGNSCVYVVACLAETTAQSIINELMSYGIEKERIVYKLNHVYSESERAEFLKRIIRTIKLYDIAGLENRLCIVGNSYGDGGYVMLDDFEHNDKIAYSFGISTDVSWDKDMASRGFDVYMYDHTISSLPEENDRFHWSKLGLASDYTNHDDVRTLDNLIKINGHQDLLHMILKMDVEGCEWGFLFMVDQSTLLQFDQIVLEIHGMDELNELRLLALSKLAQTHAMVHIHYNNCARLDVVEGIPVIDAFEVTFVKRELYNLYESSRELPNKLDSPCNPRIPDIQIGNWNAKAI